MVKNSPANAGEMSSIPGSGRPPGGGNGNPFQYSCLENTMDRGAWQATVHGVAKSQIQLTTHTLNFQKGQMFSLFSHQFVVGTKHSMRIKITL